MPLPATIRPAVSSQTIDKVGRLFNGSAGDVLNELLQNARRAGATRIDIVRTDLAGHPTFIVRDDGRGIDDPASLLTLGASDWTDHTRANEDPAGMGVFSMAGLRVEYRSWSRTAGQGWRVVIDADAWSGKRDLAIEPFDIVAGTEVLIDLPATWDARLETAVSHAARHYPLPVSYQSQEVERRDWLAGALHVETWRGSRIGVFQETSGSIRQSLNFHGLIVAHQLPFVSEVDRGLCWIVKIDIGETPELQLVLPARKEVVQTPFLGELNTACEAAIFRAIAMRGRHRLSYESFCRARELGVELGEADPTLHAWTPEVADGSHQERGLETRRPMIRMCGLEPALAQTLARAIARNPDFEAPLVGELPRFEGYGWYDALDRVRDVRIRATRDGVEHDFDEIPDAFESGPVEHLTIDFFIESASGEAKRIQLPTDVALVDINAYGADLDNIAILLGPDPAIAPDELADMLERACFSPSDDSDADSWDTQKGYFEREALQIARTLLVSEEAAILGRATDRVADHISWQVPEGRTMLIATDRTGTMACFQDRDAAFVCEEAFTSALLAHAKRGMVDPSQASDAIAEIRAVCHERALDLMAAGARARASGEGGGEG